VSGKCAKCEKGCKKYGIRKGPLKSDIGDLEEEIFEDQIERSLVFRKLIHLLEEEDHNIDQDQTAQA
jgi:hypothetical protein